MHLKVISSAYGNWLGPSPLNPYHLDPPNVEYTASSHMKIPIHYSIIFQNPVRNVKAKYMIWRELIPNLEFGIDNALTVLDANII